MARMGQMRALYRSLVGKRERKRTIEKPKQRWNENIKIDLQELDGGVDWIDLAQDRDKWRAVVKVVIKL